MGKKINIKSNWQLDLQPLKPRKEGSNDLQIVYHSLRLVSTLTKRIIVFKKKKNLLILRLHIFL
jgi:hypothetical protein